MDYTGFAFTIIGIFAIIIGFLAYTKPNSIFAKFTITLFKINHRIKGILAIAVGLILIAVGILYYFQ